MIDRLQKLLQWGFLRVEALFNAVFGVRLNPLYHLGATAFFLFWLVAGSGLYLYAFFETGVADAYRSVEALTRDQWFAGGVLRSVHRYASDAMVLTMLLHMLRHFAFNRLRGFRWFSWVSGVALIWSVYVAGINGYMLPWDRLSQFVIIASFEWLDWLPGFGGTLVRNFIYPSSVNDRLFSLLAFMHIGIPLLVLLLMWIHIQRVAKAKTSPPRPIVLGTVLMLIALALFKPVLSQGGTTDLRTVPADLGLDWFYLAIFPLLYAWPLAWVWLLLASSTVAIAALPWIPTTLRRSKTGAFRMTIDGISRTLTVRAGETLLEAGLREGIPLPYECRSGGCGVCLCTVLRGSVDYGAYQRSALPDTSRAQHMALMCCATPTSDLDIEVAGETAKQGTAVRAYDGRIDALEHLGENVIRLIVSLPGGERIKFSAGQYINVLLEDGQRRAYSFANPPHSSEHIELHVRRIPGGRFTGHVFNAMKVGDPIRFEGPFGLFTLRASERAILFVAGATGFAPVKSIIEDAFERGSRRPMWLYWGVRTRQDLYLADLAEQWQREHDNFHFVPVLSESFAGDGWTGRRGLVHEAMLADFPDMRGYEVYLCGSVRMVDTAVPAFVEHGLAEDLCFADAFVPAAVRPG